MHICHTGKRPNLLIANLVDISQYSLDGKDSSRLVYGDVIGGTLALDVNQHDGYIYWADYVKRTIARAPVNDTKNVAVVANDKLTRAEGIAVDWIGEKLYWTNSGMCKCKSISHFNCWKTLIFFAFHPQEDRKTCLVFS